MGWCLVVFVAVSCILSADLFILNVLFCILFEKVLLFVVGLVHFVSEFVPFVWKLGLKRRCDSLKFQVFYTFAYDHGRQLLRWSFVDYRP